MSSIVKAKWITQETVIFQAPAKKCLEEEIKLEQQPSPVPGIKPNEVKLEENADTLRVANDLMKSAIKSSQEIKQKSHELGYNEGYNAGYEAGLKQGSQEGLLTATAKAELGIIEIQEVIECLNRERQTALENQDEDLLAIAFEISKKIMRQQVQEDKDVFLKVFDEVIHGDEEGLKIYLSENQKTLDFHVNREMAEKLKKLSSKSKVIIIRDEDKIMVETNDAVIDMSLPVQLNQLKKAIEQSS